MAEKRTINPKTGLVDYLDGDHSAKMFINKFWTWILAFIPFIVFLILQIVRFETICGWVADAYSEGLGTLIFVCPFLLLPIVGSSLIGYFIFYKYWKQLKGEINGL